jgi:hypothetical protein
MTRRQPNEPRTGREVTATDWRRLAYHYWPDGLFSGRYFAKLADKEESLEPIAHQPAGTVGIGELLKVG